MSIDQNGRGGHGGVSAPAMEEDGGRRVNTERGDGKGRGGRFGQALGGSRGDCLRWR